MKDEFEKLEKQFKTEFARIEKVELGLDTDTVKGKVFLGKIPPLKKCKLIIHTGN